MKKKQDLYTYIAFGTGLASGVTIFRPALSMILAAIGIVFGILAFNAPQKWMARAGLIIGIIALIASSIYLFVTLADRA